MQTHPLTAEQVLQRYEEEHLPAFIGIHLTNVNQVGHFGERPLDVAVVRGLLEEVDALLAAGADVNGLGEHGNTPLHEAVGQGHVHVVQRLLAVGARRDICNAFGDTALDIARMANRSELAGLLQSAESNESS